MSKQTTAKILINHLRNISGKPLIFVFRFPLDITFFTFRDVIFARLQECEVPPQLSLLSVVAELWLNWCKMIKQTQQGM